MSSVCCRQTLEAGERRAQKTAKARAAAARGNCGQAVAGEALQKAADGDATFQSRQAQAGALVDAKAKRQMLVVGAVQSQFARLIKHRRVAVGRADAQRDQRACGKVRVADPAGFERAPVAELVG